MTDPILVQRLEGAAVTVLSVTLFVLIGAPWWWLLAAFLAFDLSALGSGLKLASSFQDTHLGRVGRPAA